MTEPKFRLTWDLRVWEDIMTEKEIKERTSILIAALKSYGILKCEMNVMDLELAEARLKDLKSKAKEESEE